MTSNKRHQNLRGDVGPIHLNKVKQLFPLGLQGVGARGPSTPPGHKSLPSQIPAVLRLTLLYKDTRRREKTIISDYQKTNSDNIFNTVRTQSSKNSVEAIVVINLSWSGRIRTPSLGGEYQFHTLESDTQNIHSDLVKGIE